MSVGRRRSKEYVKWCGVQCCQCFQTSKPPALNRQCNNCGHEMRNCCRMVVKHRVIP